MARTRSASNSGVNGETSTPAPRTRAINLSTIILKSPLWQWWEAIAASFQGDFARQGKWFREPGCWTDLVTTSWQILSPMRPKKEPPSLRGGSKFMSWSGQPPAARSFCGRNAISLVRFKWFGSAACAWINRFPNRDRPVVNSSQWAGRLAREAVVRMYDRSPEDLGRATHRGLLLFEKFGNASRFCLGGSCHYRRRNFAVGEPFVPHKRGRLRWTSKQSMSFGS